MKAKLLSIIIPAYNVAAYIERCIRSLENQDISQEDYEIIVVNDGSPDAVQEVVERLQKEFHNIILINQENQGVSIARNNGIAMATGTYILPIDPDDYVVHNSFKQFVTCLEKQEVDVVYLPFEFFDKNGKSIWRTDFSKKTGQIYSGLDGYFEPRGLSMKDPDRSWAMLYRKTVLNQYAILYPKNVPYLEDGLFLAKVFSVAEKVIFCDDNFYQRTTREGSATNSKLLYSDKAINGFLLAIDDIKQFAIQNQLNQEQQLLINHVVAKFVFLPLTASLLSSKKSNFFKVYHILKEKKLDKLDLAGCRGTYLLYGKAYNKSIIHFMVVFYSLKFKRELNSKFSKLLSKK